MTIIETVYEEVTYYEVHCLSSSGMNECGGGCFPAECVGSFRDREDAAKCASAMLRAEHVSTVSLRRVVEELDREVEREVPDDSEEAIRVMGGSP